jgi:hypothetical protein
LNNSNTYNLARRRIKAKKKKKNKKICLKIYLVMKGKRMWCQTPLELHQIWNRIEIAWARHSKKGLCYIEPL